MDKPTKEIVLQGKEAIINHVFTIIEENMPSLKINFEDYEIKAWANKEEVLVKFRRLIKYYPINKSGINYDFSFNVITQETDLWSADDFYVPTKQDLKNIEFVIEHFSLPSRNEFEISIYEGEDQFSINVDNEVAFGRYFIDKYTGEESPGIQSSYVPMPLPKNSLINEDPLIEILDSTNKDEIIAIISSKTSAKPNIDKFMKITNILSIEEFEMIKKFILKKGDKRSYRNYDNANPHYHFNDFHTYLNAEIGQRNMYNDPEISDFNEITIHDWNEHDLQYYTIRIIRKGDIDNERIYVEEEMKEGSIYLLNSREKDLNLMLKNFKEIYLVKLRNQIDAHR